MKLSAGDLVIMPQLVASSTFSVCVGGERRRVVNINEQKHSLKNI